MLYILTSLQFMLLFYFAVKIRYVTLSTYSSAVYVVCVRDVVSVVCLASCIRWDSLEKSSANRYLKEMHVQFFSCTITTTYTTSFQWRIKRHLLIFIHLFQQTTLSKHPYTNTNFSKNTARLHKIVFTTEPKSKSIRVCYPLATAQFASRKRTYTTLKTCLHLLSLRPSEPLISSR